MAAFAFRIPFMSRTHRRRRMRHLSSADVTLDAADRVRQLLLMSLAFIGSRIPTHILTHTVALDPAQQLVGWRPQPWPAPADRRSAELDRESRRRVMQRPVMILLEPRRPRIRSSARRSRVNSGAPWLATSALRTPRRTLPTRGFIWITSTPPRYPARAAARRIGKSKRRRRASLARSGDETDATTPSPKTAHILRWIDGSRHDLADRLDAIADEAAGAPIGPRASRNRH